MAVLPDGRVVTRGNDQRVLVWDPAFRGPAALGRHGSWVAQAVPVAVLPDGRVVTAGDDDRLLGVGSAHPRCRPGRAGPLRQLGGGGVARLGARGHQRE